MMTFNVLHAFLQHHERRQSLYTWIWEDSEEQSPAMQALGKSVELASQTTVSPAIISAELARLDTAPKRQPAMSRSKSIVF